MIDPRGLNFSSLGYKSTCFSMHWLVNKLMIGSSNFNGSSIGSSKSPSPDVLHHSYDWQKGRQCTKIMLRKEKSIEFVQNWFTSSETSENKIESSRHKREGVATCQKRRLNSKNTLVTLYLPTSSKTHAVEKSRRCLSLSMSYKKISTFTLSGLKVGNMPGVEIYVRVI